ncbi:TPA: hypothetical protein KZS43_002568 [Escherichia coli]|nr:hypothetical protein [Escherichia coli]HBI2746874.1 hypothetical protein [Escherichia coli]
MQEINSNKSYECNKKFICLLTEEAEDRLQEVKNIIFLFCNCIDYEDTTPAFTNKQIYTLFEMIARNIDFIFSDSFYPGGLLNKRDINQIN